MRDDGQFKQLMLQYQQLKNGAEDIRGMLEKDDLDSALTMIKTREPIFLNCKCMRKYLELTPSQEEELNALLEELRELEISNIKTLEKGMSNIQSELKRAHQNEKIQQAYDFGEDKKGSIINITEG